MTPFLPYPDITTISDAEFSLVTVTPHSTDPTSPATASVASRSLAQEQVSGGYCGVGGWLEPLTAPSQEMLSGSLAGYANPFPTPQCAYVSVTLLLRDSEALSQAHLFSTSTG